MTKPFPFTRATTLGLVGVAVALFVCLEVRTSAQRVRRQAEAAPSSSTTGAPAPVSSHRHVLERYCVTCHNARLKTGGLQLDGIDVANPAAEADVW